MAVLLVVAFHMKLSLPQTMAASLGRLLHLSSGVSLFPSGGFVGVDVFFVISGFLISGILLREQRSGTFSILKFYERRVRRIVPAFAAVLVTLMAVAWFAFFPKETQDFARSELASMLSVSNVFFWKTSGYFDAPALSQPLLHTWSLSVEEQFYLVFPLLLLALHRFPGGRYLKVAVVVMTLVSLTGSIVLLPKHTSSTFYLPFTRAWELLAGTVVALDLVRLPASRLGRNLASLLGLVMIFIAAFLFDSTTPFPGAAALLPCAGAVLILAAGGNGDTWTGRLLSLRAFVFLGWISYSLYLWHWPLLLMNRLEYFSWFHVGNAFLLGIMLCVSTLSWRYIEQPFRTGKLRLSRAQIFGMAACMGMMLVGLNIWAIASQGFPGRLHPDQRQLNRYLENKARGASWGSCFGQKGAPITAGCLMTVGDHPNVLLFGDSHAAHLWYGLTATYPEIHFVEATASSCKPLLVSLSSKEDFCRDLAKRVFENYLPSHPRGDVILSSIWTENDVTGLADTMRRLRTSGARIYVVGPIILYDQLLPALLLRSNYLADPSFPSRHLYRSMQEYELLDRHLEQAALQNGAFRYISLRKMLCTADQCLHYAAPGVPLQADSMHLTDEGSLLVARKLREHGVLP